jgi:hypothetical protein
MRVRIVKPFYFKARDMRMVPGQLVTVPDEDAKLWLRHGMAMEDKTVDVQEQKPALVAKPEPAVTEPVKPAIKRRRKK